MACVATLLCSSVYSMPNNEYSANINSSLKLVLCMYNYSSHVEYTRTSGGVNCYTTMQSYSLTDHSI